MNKLKISASRGIPSSFDLLVLPVAHSGKASDAAKKNVWAVFDKASKTILSELDSKHDNAFSSAIRAYEYQPKTGKRLDISLGTLKSARLSGVARLDEEEIIDAQPWLKLGGDTLARAKSNQAGSVAIYLDGVSSGAIDCVVQHVVEGLCLANYSFDKYKKKTKSNKTISIALVGKSLANQRIKSIISAATVRAEATSLTRDLVNEPPSTMQPKHLVSAAKKIASGKNSKITQKTYTEAQLRQMGAHAILAVSRGSDAPAYMTHLSYKPGSKSKSSKRVVLVGKGVTYDSGGLSIKSRNGLMTMKCDMAGAGAVLGVMHAIAKMPKAKRPKHEVHMLVPTAENMINGSSVKPGDVVTALNGKTIEILNTDAEGRLLLADALSYTKRIKPDIVIDVATLTGACVAALGDQYAGVFTEDDDLCDRLVNAAADSGEGLWRLPLDDCYRSAIDSKVANIKNIGGGGAPGATTAALFLKEFVAEDTRWAHIDIAGPAFIDKANEFTPAGGSGFGVRTLLNFIEQL